MSVDWERLQPLVAIDESWLLNFMQKTTGQSTLQSIQPLGGLIDSNYRVECGGVAYFVRVVTNGADGAAKEMALQSKLAECLPFARTLDAARWDGHTVMLQEWIEGVTVASALETGGESEAEPIGRAIGETLSKLSGAGFATHGFLNENGTVANAFSLKADGYLEYMYEALMQAQWSLGLQLTEQCWEYVQQQAECLNNVPPDAHLCHGDLHLNNVLVARPAGDWKVAGIVDWSSALSWNALYDMAQLLRLPVACGSALERGLLAGYAAGGGWLPEDWNTLRNLLQLLGWVDKLAVGEDRPRVIESARQQVGGIVLPDQRPDA